MDRTRFLEYLKAYNAGDLSAIEQHYTSDIIFENFGARQQGADVMAFIKQLKTMVSDRMTPLAILFDGDQIAVEMDDEIVAKQDLPHLPAGAMKKGEKVTIRMFAFYRVVDGKIAHIRVAGWPPTR